MQRKLLSWIAGLLVLLMVAAAAAIPLVGLMRERNSIVIHGRMAETGGWTPTDLRAEVNEPLHLRLTSDDVMHSFAVGQSEMEPVDVVPGKMSEVTLTFDRPGKYTFYCTRWCGPNHWRMRGVIEVAGEGEASVEETSANPLYAELGIDIDQPHPAAVTPAARPSAARGEEFIGAGAQAEIPPPKPHPIDWRRAGSCILKTVLPATEKMAMAMACSPMTWLLRLCLAWPCQAWSCPRVR
jgi:hypothetical protein